MNALLIGTEMDSVFHTLHQNLQTNTLTYAQEKLGSAYNVSQYSPWLCFLPLLSHVDSRLLAYSPAIRGGWVIEEDMVEAMAAFLSADGRAAIAELPGDASDWLPRTQRNTKTAVAALELIQGSDPVMQGLYNLVVSYVVSLGVGRNRGYSTHLARGVIFRSLPEDNDSYEVAIDIMHEVGHQVLMVWQSVDPILASDPSAPVFSQIRRTNRPAIQSFHAAVALAYMRYFQKTMPNDAGMQTAAAKRGKTYSQTLSYSLELAVASLRTSCEFTDVGTKMIEEMEDVI